MRASPHPHTGPWMVANTVPPTASVASTSPAQSIERPRGSADSGISSAAATSPISPTGTLIQNTESQWKCSVSGPPMTGPSPSPRPDTPAQIPIAVPRSRSPVNTCRRIDSVPGSTAAAPAPCTTRPVSSQPYDSDSAHIAEPPVKSASPAFIRNSEIMLGLLHKAGMPTRDAAYALHLIVTYVQGYVLQEIVPMSAQEAAESRTAALEQLRDLPPAEFPRVRDGADDLTSTDVDGRFVFGIRCITAGLPRAAAARDET